MPSGGLEQHRQSLHAFSAKLLEGYIEDLRSRAGSLDQKEFNDPIWQTIVLQPLEVAILDSPLLQRLRLIRQLGVVHWVYPGATHTRFEHTLGVIHQVQNLIASINRHPSEPEQLTIPVPTANLLRLIALCHDVGHGFMSHVSENALRNFVQVEDLVFDFCETVGIERTKPSELAAYYIVGSPAFGRLLGAVRDKYPQHQLPTDLIAQIQAAIIGKQISDNIPLLHELINGPFDADKLDYMPRDARMTGVPVVTDIPRLVQKVRATQVRQEKLPERVARAVKGGLPYYWMTGIALSGGRTLDELMLGRALLFDKIYRHQKVRAAEAMVAAILERMSQILSQPPAMLPYMVVDDQLVNIDLQAIAGLVERDLTEQEAEIAGVAIDVAKRLRERRLFVRAFAFSLRMPLDPYKSDIRQRVGREDLIRDSQDFERRGQLVSQIAGEVRNILQLLQEEELLSRFSDSSLRSYIWIDPPDAPSQGSEVNNAHLITPNGEILLFKDETAEARGWTDAYPLARDLGFVFTTAELSSYVFLATEKTVSNAYGVKFPRSVIDYAKRPEGLIDQLRRDLARAGYYNDAPYELTPIPERLLMADVQNRLGQLSDTLRGYAGPYRDDSVERKSESGLKVEWERIRDWLRQFSDFADEKVVSEALDMVTRVRLIGRTEIVTSMRRFLENNVEFKGALVCPLGEPKDSSSICTYLAGDLQKEYNLEITSLANALAEEGARPILFVEDFIGSGQQPVTILEGMLGEDLSYSLGEKRHSLSKSSSEALRNRRLGFTFAAGLTEGVNRLKERVENLGLSARVDAVIEEKELPRAFPEEALSPTQELLRTECIKIGQALLDDGDPRHTPEWIENKVLGYGNRGLLIVFPYNTPAQTLTCLWAEGKVGSRFWSPLFPRRKKK